MDRPIALASGLVIGAAAFVRERRLRLRAERFTAASLETLLNAIDANDSQTGAHVRRVAGYAMILADALGVDEEERRTIELTALFHDIGKIHEALFDILHDPGKLTPTERREIATHPARGAAVLAPIANFHPRLAAAVLSHHEHWDGSGYPRGLKGRRIPLAARVVTLADTFDAITHTRRYRPERSAEVAAEVIMQGHGTQFDPMLVDLMMLPPVFDQIRAAQRKSGRLGAKLPTRRRGKAHGSAPKIRIRWRSRTDAPEPVREELAAR
jgi:putative two-component system response regulator